MNEIVKLLYRVFSTNLMCFLRNGYRMILNITVLYACSRILKH